MQLREGGEGEQVNRRVNGQAGSWLRSLLLPSPGPLSSDARLSEPEHLADEGAALPAP